MPGLRRRDGGGAAAAGEPAAPAGRGAARPPGRGQEVTADLSVRLQPRARKDEIVGERGGAIVIRVTAPPVDGKANDALCRLVAKKAGVPASRVSVIRGQTARDKVIRVEGVEIAALRAVLAV